MRVLTVVAHPNSQSFTHATANAFTRGLADGKHESQVVDLHAIGFNPVFQVQDYAQFPGSPLPGGTPMEVLDQQVKVAWAEGLAFVAPVLWMGFPAILKGWIERVFTYGFAYSLSPEGWQGDLSGRIPLLKHKKALIIGGTFFSERDYQLGGWGPAIRKTVDEWTFAMPGIGNVQRVMFHALHAAGEEARKQHLETAFRLGKEF
jgi:NAD(P)H dehydrogenase (quinone)